MQSKRRTLHNSVLLLLFGAATGCGGDGLNRASVEGMVTVDGTPIPEGNMAMIPMAGTTGPSAGATITDGKYFISSDKGPVPGTYRVEIKAIRKTGRQIVDSHKPPPDNLVDETEQYIPPEYNVESTLSVQLQAGKNQNVDFQLTTKEQGDATR